MDPLSVAGLALGVAGIGFQVYEGCIQGTYSPVTCQWSQVRSLTAISFPRQPSS